MSMEIRPTIRWVVTSIAVAAIWWMFILAIGLFGWTSADWTARAIIGWVFLLSAATTVFMVARWRSLSLIADETQIRFGQRVLPRSRVSAISTGPVAATATEFWAGVLVLAMTQDLSRKVYFRAADGRPLLETTDLYGSAQLTDLAAYLGIPFMDNRRRRAGSLSQ